jgi:cobaltochelatase CobN
VRAEGAALVAGGHAPEDATRQALWRVFSAPPGGYGAGLGALIDGGGWRDRAALADAFLSVGGYAYSADAYGVAARPALEARLGQVAAIAHNQDNREHDLLDSDDYYQFEGGLSAAVETLTGRAPVVYHNDHARPEAPKIRTLPEEIARVVRARAVNPKWIEGMMRHGYKGAFELAATVDYLFAFAATTEAVRSYQFDLLYDAYLGDPAVEAFIAAHNPAVLREMAERFLEAEARGMWRPRANSAASKLNELSQRVTA